MRSYARQNLDSDSQVPRCLVLNFAVFNFIALRTSLPSLRWANEVER